jgi:hypothetical protein
MGPYAHLETALRGRVSERVWRLLHTHVWLRLHRGEPPPDIVSVLRRTPDDDLLRWRGLGPKAVAEIRRHVPYAPQGAPRAHPWWLVP